MLQRHSLQEQRHSLQELRPEENPGQTLTPSYLYDVIKRRALYFAIPFIIVLGVGSLISVGWPAIYLARGTILVASQEIPSDLVRPTVAALASDRIRVIEQRIMTRDNLLEIAKKFRLAPGWQERLSGTETVDFVRKRTEIKPSELSLAGQQKNAIAFEVGFKYEQPLVAAKVANELVTMILREDARSRSDYASETTRFLANDVKRLETQLSLNDAQITALIQSNNDALTDSSVLDDGKELAVLRAQLILLSANYSSTHPDIIALKRKIKALEKTNAAKTDQQKQATTTEGAGAKPLSLDALQTQRLSLKEELNKASQRLAAARLGENLERGQHSERLEVIEQPTIPQKPITPNRPKIFAFVVALALMAGGGLAFSAEMLDQSIYRKSDLSTLVDSQLIVTIPYIATNTESRRRKFKVVGVAAVSVVVILGALAAGSYLLPPPDVLVDKIMARLFG